MMNHLYIRKFTEALPINYGTSPGKKTVFEKINRDQQHRIDNIVNLIAPTPPDCSVFRTRLTSSCILCSLKRKTSQLNLHDMKRQWIQKHQRLTRFQIIGLALMSAGLIIFAGIAIASLNIFPLKTTPIDESKLVAIAILFIMVGFAFSYPEL